MFLFLHIFVFRLLAFFSLLPKLFFTVVFLFDGRFLNYEDLCHLIMLWEFTNTYKYVLFSHSFFFRLLTTPIPTHGRTCYSELLDVQPLNLIEWEAMFSPPSSATSTDNNNNNNNSSSNSNGKSGEEEAAAAPSLQEQQQRGGGGAEVDPYLVKIHMQLLKFLLQKGDEGSDKEEEEEEDHSSSDDESDDDHSDEDGEVDGSASHTMEEEDGNALCCGVVDPGCF